MALKDDVVGCEHICVFACLLAGWLSGWMGTSVIFGKCG